VNAEGVGFSAKPFAEIVAAGEGARLCRSDSLRLTARLPDTRRVRYKPHRFWTPTVIGSGSVQRGSRAEATAKAGLSVIRPWSAQSTPVTSTRPEDGKTL
jgi:hypothetical protein